MERARTSSGNKPPAPAFPYNAHTPIYVYVYIGPPAAAFTYDPHTPNDSGTTTSQKYEAVPRQAHRFLYHAILGLRVIKKTKKTPQNTNSQTLNTSNFDPAVA